MTVRSLKRTIHATPVRPESVAAARAQRIPSAPLAVALVAVINRGSFHGSDLHVRVGDAYLAARAIVLATRLGWIERGDFDPNLAQRCVGIQGKRNLPDEHRDPLGYHYLTITFRYLEVDEVHEILIGGGVL